VIPCSDGTLVTNQRSKPNHDDKHDAGTRPNGSEETGPKDSTTSTEIGSMEGPDLVVIPPKKPAARKKSTRKKKGKGGKQEEEKRKEMEEAQKAKEEGQDPDKSTQPKAQPSAHGNHWGMVIVDKEQKVAYWVDSAVALKQVGRKMKIDHMYNPAIVGGKVLCGIDTILSTQESFEKGQFRAGTLKYVPQQRFHNDCDQDLGACGPFMFAFLEHLYSNQAKMERLKASFPRHTGNDLRFNSLSARREIQRLIELEVESRDKMPFQLTPDLLHTLKLIPVDRLIQMVQEFKGPRSSLPYSSGAGNETKGGGGGSGGGGGAGDGGDDDNDDDDDGDDSDGTYGYPSLPKAEIREAISGLSADVLSIVPSKTGRRAIAHEALVVAQKLLDGKGNNAAEKSEADKDKVAKALEAKRRMESKFPPAPTRRPNIIIPEGRQLPTDFADDEDVPSDELENWVDANQELIQRLDLGRKATHTSKRAALMVLAGIDFEYESEYRLKRYWLADEEVFTPDHRKHTPPRGIMIDFMKKRYDPLCPKSDDGIITLEELNKLVTTQNLHQHPSIAAGRTPNEYTYRAILHVQNGNSFKTESKKRLKEMWVKDTNVFQAGEDFELQEDGAPKLLNHLHEDQIRTRMQVAYEASPEVLPDDSPEDEQNDDPEDKEDDIPGDSSDDAPNDDPSNNGSSKVLVISPSEDTGGTGNSPSKKPNNSSNKPAQQTSDNKKRKRGSEETETAEPQQINNNKKRKRSSEETDTGKPQQTNNNMKRTRGSERPETAEPQPPNKKAKRNLRGPPKL
jgi:hypothetical protein